MSSLSAALLEIIHEVGENLAGRTLNRTTARLYSHHTKLRDGTLGLPSWESSETVMRLRDAEKLLEAGLLLFDSTPVLAKQYLRRAAELFEWIDLLPDKPTGLPYVFFTAATYQLAGYPARSLGVLNSRELDGNYSKSLAYFLRGNFSDLQQSALEGLIQIQNQYTDDDSDQTQLSFKLTETVLRCFGIFCAWIRWGDETRLENAFQELNNVSRAMLYGQDSYAWLLSKLIAKISEQYISISLRKNIAPLNEVLNDSGKNIIQRYIRQSFLTNRTLTWPSQQEGIRELISGTSFALCTPTGSGKTRIAELAILQSLFSDVFADQQGQSRIVLYLVPSRALAAEVENTISQVLRGIKIYDVTVTSMYGGNDWGPSDALIDLDNSSVIISTHEKAEALIRFIGTEFIRRICCLVLDEAHSVAFDNKYGALRESKSRALHLETLVSRLFSFFDRENVRIVALSAVAAGIETCLAQWVAGKKETKAISTQYRSTRQLVGRLECRNDGSTRIIYDLLDGHVLHIQGAEDEDRPYVPNPFPKHPPVSKAIATSASDEVKMRAHLLWAAIHLASRKDDSDNFHPVLISVTANPGYFAKTFIELLENDWINSKLPCFFLKPVNPLNEKIYKDCLATCADYFGKKSREYRLLKHGIVLHHGKMPQAMSGLLVQLVKSNIINIVLATSTLSEGVNLPVETILIPTLVRYPDVLPAKEFSNLIGRAGRPGNTTEGRSLVLVNPASRQPNIRKTLNQYIKIIKEIYSSSKGNGNDENALNGPLSALISYIYKKWSELTRSDDISEFIFWLETAQGTYDDALFALDTLDGLLLSAIHEFEEIDDKQTDLETYLGNLWKQTFSYYVKDGEKIYAKVLKKRGSALANNIYPDKSMRTALYNTSLPPRDGSLILQKLDEFTVLLQEGIDYVAWENEQRFDYLIRLIDAVRVIPSFFFSDENHITIKQLLSWWMWPNNNASKKPKAASISQWYNLGSQKFSYLFNWGIGSLIGTILNQDGLSGTTMERWQDAGLPWSIIWIKDLMSWGIYDPVAAFLLSQKKVLTRQDAIIMAKDYWRENKIDDGDLLLDPRNVKKWFGGDTSIKEPKNRGYGGLSISVKPLTKIKLLPSPRWRVLPIVSGNSIKWYDVAGYLLAKSDMPKKWDQFSSMKNCNYFLQPEENTVVMAVE